MQIAENICLILPLHKILDEINEKNRGEEKLGTTKKGIGPAYEDKIGRRAIRLCDLSDEKLLRKKITNLISFHSVRLIHFDKKINEADLINKLLKKFPAMTLSIFKGIYVQALKLFIKRVPFLGHSGKP